MPELAGIDAWLAQREATVPALRPHCAKTIVWADEADVQTDICVLYIHGFSATLQELRPLPDLVAKGLGANLFFTRLAGHGQDRDAMGAATLEQWQDDVDEAFDVAALLGRRVLVIGCSTGCTLTTLKLARGAEALGVVQISPNYGLRHPVGQALLDNDLARKLIPELPLGRGVFPIQNEGHAKYWTPDYPAKATYPMGDAIAAVRALDVSRLKTPMLMVLNSRDQVIDPREAKGIMAAWGSPVDYIKLMQTPKDDRMGHLMAGDIFSPNQTAPLVQQILDWARGLV